MHVAIIMDGNGRWATAKGLPRLAGHRAGAEAVHKVVEASLAQGIEILTLFAFSSENWLRPRAEVAGLMRIFGDYLRGQQGALAEHGIRFRLIGRRDRLEKELLAAVHETEARTAGGGAMRLRLAIDYSGRDAILRAARELIERGQEGRAAPEEISLDRVPNAAAPGPSWPPRPRAQGGSPRIVEGRPQLVGEDPSREEFSRLLGVIEGEQGSAPDVDLLIRTGGEERLSDFCLWESAFAEMVFLRTMWPDFTGDDLAAALDQFRARQRRFGRLPERVAG